MRTQSILIRNKTFFKIWLAQLLSMFGDVFYDVAIVWYLVDRTGSALIAGGIAIATMLARMLGAVVIGQRIDQLSTKKVMLTIDFIRTVVLSLVLFSIIYIEFSIVVFYIVSFVISFFNACYTVARQKSVAEIVEKSELVNANGFEGVSGAIVQILSWGVGGWVVLNFGVVAALSINTMMADRLSPTVVMVGAGVVQFILIIMAGNRNILQKEVIKIS